MHPGLVFQGDPPRPVANQSAEILSLQPATQNDQKRSFEETTAKEAAQADSGSQTPSGATQPLELLEKHFACWSYERRRRGRVRIPA